MNQNQFVDYYEDLQVSPNADMETIERIYRLFAKRYHPDNSTSGDAEGFNIITEAYRLLSDPEKRAAYDAKYEEEKIRQYKAVSNISPSEALKPIRAYAIKLCRSCILKEGENHLNLVSVCGGWKSCLVGQKRYYNPSQNKRNKIIEHPR